MGTNTDTERILHLLESTSFLQEVEACTSTGVAELEAVLPEVLAGLQKWGKRQIERLLKEDPDNPLFANFGLYEAMDYGRLETAHTNTLAFLLDPDGGHGFGRSMCDALLKRMNGRANWRLPGQATDIDIVEAERIMDGPRLDVYVVGHTDKVSWDIVIEAKVGARESDEQCSKLESIRGRKSLQGNIFLTPEGRRPETGDVNAWFPMSFGELCDIFWSAARIYPQTRNEVGYAFLRLYIAGVFSSIYHLQLPARVEKDGSITIGAIRCLHNYLAHTGREAYG